MQTIEFLRNFFTKGLEIHDSFYRNFSSFFKKIRISNFKIIVSKFEKKSNFRVVNISNLKNHRILNLKNCRILNRCQKVDSTASKSTSTVLSELYYEKSFFVKAAENYTMKNRSNAVLTKNSSL
jgi:hypothetical protein